MSVARELASLVSASPVTSGANLEKRGPAGSGAASAGVLLLSTAELTVVDSDQLGRIDFQAPLETGTDAIVVAASIYAEADDTFAADNNSTELVFAVGASEAAAEKMRLTHDGELGIGVATPASLLHVAGTVQVGVDDTGYDVTFFGDASGAFMRWDTSADSLLVRGATADAAGSTGRIVLQTAQVSVEDGDVLGRIDFQAPLETQGSDGILVSASIHAEADGTFSATVNSTELVFSTATDAAVVERMRIDHGGNIGIGTSTPAKLLTVSAATPIIRLDSTEGNVGNTDILGALEWKSADAQRAGDPAAAIRAVNEGADGSNTELHFLTNDDGDAAAERLKIMENGRLKATIGGSLLFDCGDANNGTGIAGAAAGGDYTLKVHGSIGAASFNNTSDRRAKENIVDSKINATELINKLRVVDFTWKDSTETSYNKRNLRGTSTGIIAQEAIEHIPTIVHTPRVKETLKIDEDSDEMWSIDNGATQMMLLKAVQELSAKVKTLEEA